MIGSFIRSVLFFVLVAIVAYAIWYVLSTPGEVVVTFGGREWSTTPLIAVALILFGFLALWVLFRVLGLLVAVVRFVLGDETAVSRYWSRRDHQIGLLRLKEAMTAQAAGDPRRALERAEKASGKLRSTDLTRIITAQAADAAGERDKAREQYNALAEDPDTAIVGVKGLMDQALREGDTERALKLARAGLKLKPRDSHVLETLYTLQSQKFDWAGARRTLAQQKKAGLLEKPEAYRRDAMLALAQAEDAEESGEQDHARRLAVEAAKADPANPEAAAAAARLLVREGSKRQAAKLLIEAWKHTPSPQIAAAYAAIEPDEAPAERRRRFEKLITVNPEHDESRFTTAELALITDDFRAARGAISDLRETEPSARSCAIMAAVARGEGAPEAEVRGWLARALGAPRGTAPDTLIGHAAMLPLLMGSDDDARASDAEEVPAGSNGPAPKAQDESVEDADVTPSAAAPEPAGEAAPTAGDDARQTTAG